MADGRLFHEAAERGMVDVSSDYWSRQDMPSLLAELRLLKPGIINRFAFLYGGPTAAWLDKTKAIAGEFHAADPTALLGATLPEALRDGYSVALPCGSFKAADMTSTKQAAKISWIDLSRPAGEAYYKCLGETFIDDGFGFIHFEAPSSVIAHARDQNAAKAAYARLTTELRAYGRKAGKPIFLSGNEELSNLVHLDAVYLPSRFYHNLPAYLQFRDKVERPGIGVGYSYVLSQAIIAQAKSKVPAGVEIFFEVDNWDSSQDDLRRLMELDAPNRRYMLEESIKRAEANGVHFVPPLEHCVGCIPPTLVGDKTEIRNDARSEYRAAVSGDDAAIKR